MATTYSLSASASLALRVALQQNLAQNSQVDLLQAGLGNFAAYSKQLSDGSTAGKAHVCWHDQRTLAAAGNDDIVLGSGSTLVDAFGVTIAMTRVVWFLLRVVTPAVDKRVLIGNHPTTPWQAWFGATTHTEEVRSFTFKENQIDAWTVAASDTLRVNNPGSVTAVYDIVVVGN